MAKSDIAKGRGLIDQDRVIIKSVGVIPGDRAAAGDIDRTSIESTVGTGTPRIDRQGYAGRDIKDTVVTGGKTTGTHYRGVGIRGDSIGLGVTGQVGESEE